MNLTKSIDREIVQYLPHLNAKQKNTVLVVMKSFVEEEQDWWDKISAQQQQAVDKSLEEMKAGKLTPHNEVMKKYDKWLKTL